MEESPREKMAFCPALSREREVWVFRPAFWYSCRERSYLLVEKGGEGGGAGGGG